jgi:hypothetical protein
LQRGGGKDQKQQQHNTDAANTGTQQIGGVPRFISSAIMGQQTKAVGNKRTAKQAPDISASTAAADESPIIFPQD